MMERILVLAPLANDAQRMAALLREHGFKVNICTDSTACADELLRGAGALLMTEEVLAFPYFERILEFLKHQPAWSELPIIVLTSGRGESKIVKLLDITQQAAGSLTLLERPLSSVTLLRSVEVALRSRQRQYQVRELIAELNSLTSDLEKKVRERTFKLEQQTQQLRHLAVEITQIEEAERKRLAQILHDHLQQLLVAAKIRLELVQRKQVPEDAQPLKEIRTFLDEAYTASRSLTAELRPPVLYESGLIPALQFLVRKYREEHGLTVHLLICDEVEPRSEVVKTFIYQSLRELLFNVIKYAATDECFLKIERSGEQIRIQLKDKGIGFDPSKLEGKSRGGFGLFSIRERIKALGGEFHVRSSPGSGAAFEFVLTEASVTAKDEEIAEVDAGSLRRKRSGPLRILIADDHKIVRQSLAQVLYLQPFVHEVLEAEDGRDAILKAQKYRPDIVIMDLNMPYLNGMEATRILRHRDPNLKIIGLSVQAEDETAQAMKRAGALEYYSKDTDTEILVEKLRDLSVA